MNLTSRAFRSEDDLFAMRRLLIAGRQAANGAYYVHAGDLMWWYGYYLTEQDPRPFTILWENAAAPGELAAWALYTSRYAALDVFVHPALRGTPDAARIWIEAEEQASLWHAPVEKSNLNTIWIGASDDWTIAHLESRGFQRGVEYIDVLAYALDEPVAPPILPAGFGLCSPRDERDVPTRAAPQYAAFKSTLPLEVYHARYARFLRGSTYALCRDTMLLNGDERAVAFCITWTDEVNRVGLFEPVGVDPAFHRQGLGRVVVTEGLRRLQAEGMRSALVCGLSELPEARAFYASLGFQPVLRLCTFEKT